MAWRNLLKASAILTALGSIALMVSQTIFQDWWNRDENRTRAELDRQQTEYLSKSLEVIGENRDAIDRSTEAYTNLNRWMEQFERRAEEMERLLKSAPQAAPAPQSSATELLPSQPPASPPLPEQTATAPDEAPAGSTALEASGEGKPAAATRDVALVPASPDATPEPSPPMPPPATTTVQPKPAPTEPPRQEARRPDELDFGGARVFGVFETQAFELCGHKGFSAELLTSSTGTEVLLKTRNRTVPGAGFRGFEQKLSLKAPVELWQGCTVAIGKVETAGRATRLIISVAEGKKA